MLDVGTLPNVATNLLLAGVESPSVVLLAGEGAKSDPVELRALLEAALGELGVPEPSRLGAAQTLKREFAVEVTTGALTPRAGAREIVLLEQAIAGETEDIGFAGSGFGIAELLGLYYALDDVEHEEASEQASHVARIEADIVRACRRLAAGEDG